MKFLNQNTSLVSSIQHYANDLYINQAAIDFGIPNQILPKISKGFSSINLSCGKIIFK